jgi:hypothetical protein
MNRATVDVSDQKTNQTNQYEGVALTQLVPNASGSRIEVFPDSRHLRTNWRFRVPILTCNRI